MKWEVWLVVLVGASAAVYAGVQLTSPGGRSLTVASDGSGDFNGDDHRPIQAAIDALPVAGGSVVVGPGTYRVRQPIRLRSGVRLIGAGRAVLRLPSPQRLVEPARAGEAVVVVVDTGEYAVGTEIGILSPQPAQAGHPELGLHGLRIAAIDGSRVTLAAPLAADLPAGSRLGYLTNAVVMYSVSDVLIEGIEFDGGLDPDLPMPGHLVGGGVWCSAPFRLGRVPDSAPCERIVIRECAFRGFYGRGVTLYHTVDSEVADCEFADIRDEAIGFDHFVRRCKALRNDITNAVWGVALNDASACVVRHNRITNCRTGLTIWWLRAFDLEGLNESNTVSFNHVVGARDALRLGAGVHRNLVTDNLFQGAVQVTEATNTVARNTCPSPTRRNW